MPGTFIYEPCKLTYSGVRAQIKFLSSLYERLGEREGGGMYAIEKLRVYQKAEEFGDRIVDLLDGKSRGIRRPLVDQLVRASTSVAANIAEGNGRWTKADRVKFFHIAKASALECIPLIHFLKTAGALSQEEEDSLRADIDEMTKMIWGLIKGVEKRRTA